MGKYDHVFQPLEIRGKTLRNRIQFSPHAPNLVTETGEVTAEYVEYVAKEAATGVGFVTLSDCQIEQKSGASFLGEPDIEKPSAIAGLTKLAEAVHENGALISIELSHAGAGANPDMIHQAAYSPSGEIIPAPMTTRNVKAMDRADMDHVRDKWVDAAVKCVRAGFDMVLVHMAHQNLLGQFLSPATNKRTDEYGGSEENRMRYPLEVLKAVRDAVGPGTIIEIRISAQEEVPGGMNIDQVVAFAKKAQAYADIINLSRGSIFFPAAGILHMPSYLSEHCLNVEFAAKVKEAVDVAVSVCGNIVTMEEAEQVLAEGKADIIGMARSLMAEPDLIKNAAAGHPEKSRPCLRCMECSAYSGTGRPIRCSVNPRLGRELEYKTVTKAEQSKKVVIIGGGPAGMTAAQVCAQRGHQVVLFEKKDHLGGLWVDASGIPSKELARNYLKWMINKTNSLKIDVRFNTTATMERIEAECPDEVIVATGSEYVHPGIKGMELPIVKNVGDVNRNIADTGEKVVVCGAGVSGIECAGALSKAGKDVTLVDMIPVSAMGSTMQPFLFMTYFLQIFPEHQVKLEGECKILSFDEKGVTVKTAQGEKHIDADTIVNALGVKPDKTLTESIMKKYPVNSHFIGDCTSAGGTLRKANAEAYAVAVKI